MQKKWVGKMERKYFSFRCFHIFFTFFYFFVLQFIHVLFSFYLSFFLSHFFFLSFSVSELKKWKDNISLSAVFTFLRFFYFCGTPIHCYFSSFFFLYLSFFPSLFHHFLLSFFPSLINFSNFHFFSFLLSISVYFVVIDILY